MDNHLSGLNITIVLERHFHLAVDTALHSGKDLFVAFLPFDKSTPCGALAFRHRRFCSHLLDYSRRALPATLLHTIASKGKLGLSSIYPKVNSNYPIRKQYNNNTNLNRKQTIPLHKYHQHKPALS